MGELFIQKVKVMAKNILPYGYIKRRGEHVITKETSIPPHIYNETGKELQVFYLQEKVSESRPYGNGHLYYACPQHIFWDRFNYGLPVHFYGTGDIFRLNGNPKKMFAVCMEAEQIIPGVYKKIYERKEYMRQFDAIFTCDERILDMYDNAHFMAYSFQYGGVYGGVLSAERFESKTKNISMICSEKNWVPLHKFRQMIAWKYRDSGLVDTYGRFDGGPFVNYEVPFDDYRYQIVIENNEGDYWFTEKILNCFAAMTIPIYRGANRISDFFNSDGIIQVRSEDDIEKAVRSCSKEDYESRLKAVKDNYNRVTTEFFSEDEYLWNHYRELIIP